MTVELDQPPLPDLRTLIGLFYAQPDQLGQFDRVESAEMPDPFRDLLAHDKHMTVTVESFHGGPVDVEVLETQTTGDHYSRKILLRRRADQGVVQFGIVRLNCSFLEEDVRREILSEQVPLGRVLIQHNVLRQVELRSLWRVQPGPDLRGLLNLESPDPIYGRTALIHCNGEPAVELLEIVTAD